MTTNSSTARPSVVLATLAAIAIVLAVCATAATVLVATDATRQHAALSGTPAATQGMAGARNEFQLLNTLGPLVDSIVAPLAPFPEADAVQIAIMARFRVHAVAGAARASDANHPVWVPLPEGAVMPDDISLERARLDRALAAFSDSGWRTRASASGDVPAAAADTLTSWLGRWRTHARSAPYAPMWGYRAGLPGVESAFDLPARNGESLFTLAQLNALAGWLTLHAALDGRPSPDRDQPWPPAIQQAMAEARARALENLAASRHHLESPLVSELRWGTRIAESGARLALAVAELQGDSLLAGRARAVSARTAFSSTGLVALGDAAIGDAADPAAPVAFELFDDEKLPFAIRTEILYATLAGSCRNTREVLFGFSARREQQLQALATRWQEHPSLGPVLGLMPAAARTLRERPASLLPADRWPTSGVLDFLLPEATAARAVLCQQPF